MKNLIKAIGIIFALCLYLGAWAYLGHVLVPLPPGSESAGGPEFCFGFGGLIVAVAIAGVKSYLDNKDKTKKKELAMRARQEDRERLLKSFGEEA